MENPANTDHIIEIADQSNNVPQQLSNHAGQVASNHADQVADNHADQVASNHAAKLQTTTLTRFSIC